MYRVYVYFFLQVCLGPVKSIWESVNESSTLLILMIFLPSSFFFFGSCLLLPTPLSGTKRSFLSLSLCASLSLPHSVVPSGVRQKVHSHLHPERERELLSGHQKKPPWIHRGDNCSLHQQKLSSWSLSHVWVSLPLSPSVPTRTEFKKGFFFILERRRRRSRQIHYSETSICPPPFLPSFLSPHGSSTMVYLQLGVRNISLFSFFHQTTKSCLLPPSFLRQHSQPGGWWCPSPSLLLCLGPPYQNVDVSTQKSPQPPPPPYPSATAATYTKKVPHRVTKNETQVWC